MERTPHPFFEEVRAARSVCGHVPSQTRLLRTHTPRFVLSERTPPYGAAEPGDLSGSASCLKHVLLGRERPTERVRVRPCHNGMSRWGCLAQTGRSASFYHGRQLCLFQGKNG